MAYQAWQDIVLYQPVNEPGSHADTISRRQGRQTPVLGLIWQCKELTMTNPQDCVYALMHLASNYEENGIQIDYKKDEVDILIDAINYHVKRARYIDFLGVTSRRTGACSTHIKRECPCLPSWLSQGWLGCSGDDASAVILTKKQKIRTQYHADSILATDRRLRVRGLRVDRVRRCLSRGLDPFTMTMEQFWNFPLGNCLRLASADMENYVYQLYSVMTRSYFWSTPAFDDMVSGLSQFFRLAQDPPHAKLKMGWKSENINDLLEALDKAAREALYEIWHQLVLHMIIRDESGNFGQVPICDLEEGHDQVWVVLGCQFPVVLRPAGNGRYRHVCGAYIPNLQDLPIIRNLSRSIQPGDKVGEWTVEDIGIE